MTLKKPRLLILDDDPLVLSSLERLLRKEFDLTCHRNPSSALDEAQATRPWACVIDLHLGEHSGLDVIRELRSLSPESLRVLLSGDLALDSIVNSLESGLIHKVINKPWDPQRLILDLKELQKLGDLIAEKNKLERQATRDPLTGLLNKRTFQQIMEQEIDRSTRTKRPLAFVMIDVDRFKTLNDQSGHPAGDHLLISLGEHLRTSLRSFDLIFRFGGDEFCFLLQETSAEQALEISERLRKTFVEKTGCSLSLGVASFPVHGKDASTLIQAADSALYQAKSQGRNQSQIAVQNPTR